MLTALLLAAYSSCLRAQVCKQLGPIVLPDLDCVQPHLAGLNAIIAAQWELPHNSCLQAPSTTLRNHSSHPEAATVDTLHKLWFDHHAAAAHRTCMNVC